MPQPCKLDRISMNIQEENSVHYFRVQSVLEQTLVNEKKGDVGMVKCFSKMYGNKGRALNYLQSESYVKMPVSS